ncbi:MAG: YkvA family protein [Gemmatimonadota bacterium]
MRGRLRQIAASVKRELAVYRLVLADPRTPRSARLFLGLGVGYLLLPFDLIPDWIPGLGHVDDLVIVPLLVAAGLRRVPPEVLADCRARVAAADAPR